MNLNFNDKYHKIAEELYANFDQTSNFVEKKIGILAAELY